MFANRVARFPPKVQALVLVALIVAHGFACWLFVDAIMRPDEVSQVRAWAGALAFSIAAEPWGVLYALAISRKKDTG